MEFNGVIMVLLDIMVIGKNLNIGKPNIKNLDIFP
jgi:hypothetical protein